MTHGDLEGQITAHIKPQASSSCRLPRQGTVSPSRPVATRAWKATAPPTGCRGAVTRLLGWVGYPRISVALVLPAGRGNRHSLRRDRVTVFRALRGRVSGRCRRAPGYACPGPPKLIDHGWPPS